jgi:DNA mismatch repair protein MutS
LSTALVNQARQTLNALEAQAVDARAQVDLFAPPPAVEPAAASAVDKALGNIDPDTLSPRDALELVYRLKKLQGGLN